MLSAQAALPSYALAEDEPVESKAVAEKPVLPAYPDQWNIAAQFAVTAVIPFSTQSGFASTTDQLVQYAAASPAPLTLGVEVYKGDPVLRYYANVGYLALTVSGKSFSIFGVKAGVRYFPWRNWFFASASVGYRYASMNLPTPSLTADTVSATNAILTLSNLYLWAGVGGDFMLSRKVSFGFDVGYLQPVFPSGSLTLQDSTGQTDPSDLSVFSGDFISTLAGQPSFQLTFPRFSWHFD